jgi:hypothetical protein
MEEANGSGEEHSEFSWGLWKLINCADPQPPHLSALFCNLQLYCLQPTGYGIHERTKESREEWLSNRPSFSTVPLFWDFFLTRCKHKYPIPFASWSIHLKLCYCSAILISIGRRGIQWWRQNSLVKQDKRSWVWWDRRSWQVARAPPGNSNENTVLRGETQIAGAWAWERNMEEVCNVLNARCNCYTNMEQCRLGLN